MFQHYIIEVVTYFDKLPFFKVRSGEKYKVDMHPVLPVSVPYRYRGQLSAHTACRLAITKESRHETIINALMTKRSATLSAIKASQEEETQSLTGIAS